MPKIYSGMPHLNGHLLTVVDFETSGAVAGYHEPLQLAAVPLDSNLEPMKGVRPFYTNMKPKFPERCDPAAMRVHKLDIDQLMAHALEADRVADMFREWFESLELPFSKVLVPVAHNYPFESSFFKAWLGQVDAESIFSAHYRDTMTIALGKNDAAWFRGEACPFNGSVSLTNLCQTFAITNERPHDALHDCLAEAKLLKCLVQMDML